ncbi:hypothetical protein H5123_08085 [Shewanella sp. SR43-4]|jgi:hypothetical protein|uniref:hypothetical protein n=1 Tax=Shewanella TaxID=22 RepID=UPI000CAC898B|nr:MULTISPECIES: hypothetical protein [Shewanella]NCQ44320.1 hypothetical protein [Shewanella frigidimarina]MBB1317598.1 hypothetical protein [Shewanella sp. SR43-4]NCO71722.1 hypothetical protein [Shewanella vesiculosa]NCP35281.1 hypothetical protein [Shewanella vesiculosa]NCP69956.1 hypothetical protein [Shewanella vesiculosa]
MIIKTRILSLAFILSMVCSCSTTPPIVIHNEYGEMSADNELFRKEASECALEARQGIRSTTLTKNSEEPEIAFASVQLLSFFSANASCIKSKGWRIKE